MNEIVRRVAVAMETILDEKLKLLQRELSDKIDELDDKVSRVQYELDDLTQLVVDRLEDQSKSSS